MAKKIKKLVRLHIAAGVATPAPPVGPTLAQHGVNIGEFCKKFNDKHLKFQKHGKNEREKGGQIADEKA